MADLVSVHMSNGKREIDLEELYAAYPEAVKLSPGFAPVPPFKVVAMPTLLSGSYNVPLGAGFAEGDTIRVLSGGRSIELGVSTLFCGNAIVKSDTQLGEMLVTAKKVADVKSVDQGQLLLAAIDMINKMHEQIDGLRAKNSILEERLKALEEAQPQKTPRGKK